MRQYKMILIVLIVLSLTGSFNLTAAKDFSADQNKLKNTLMAPENSDMIQNRIAAAKHYVKEISIQNIFQSVVYEMAMEIPEKKREEFMKFMDKAFQIQELENVVVTTMVKHFSLNEIEALSDAENTLEDLSMRKKFNTYIADVMPLIEQEIIRALKESKI